METSAGQKIEVVEQAKVVVHRLFEVASTALYYIRVPGNYSQPTGCCVQCTHL